MSRLSRVPSCAIQDSSSTSELADDEHEQAAHCQRSQTVDVTRREKLDHVSAHDLAMSPEVVNDRRHVAERQSSRLRPTCPWGYRWVKAVAIDREQDLTTGG
jgi:hypothetical protein